MQRSLEWKTGPVLGTPSYSLLLSHFSCRWSNHPLEAPSGLDNLKLGWSSQSQNFISSEPENQPNPCLVKCTGARVQGTVNTTEADSSSRWDHLLHPSVRMTEALHGPQLIDTRTLQGGRWRLRSKGQTRCDPSVASRSPSPERERSKNPQDSPEGAGPGSEEEGSVCPTGNKLCPRVQGPGLTATHHSPPHPPHPRPPPGFRLRWRVSAWAPLPLF